MKSLKNNPRSIFSGGVIKSFVSISKNQAWFENQ